MPFLIWNRRGQTTNSGSASYPVTEAAGIGHVVVEEIDGSAEYPVTEASGTGHVVSPTPPVPRVVGSPIPRPRTRRIFGSGHAEYSSPDASGRGSIRLPKRTGVGRALSGTVESAASGRVLYVSAEQDRRKSDRRRRSGLVSSSVLPGLRLRHQHSSSDQSREWWMMDTMGMSCQCSRIVEPSQRRSMMTRSSSS